MSYPESDITVHMTFPNVLADCNQDISELEQTLTNFLDLPL